LKADITDRKGVYRREITESRIDDLDEPVTHIEWLDDETEFENELSDYEEIPLFSYTPKKLTQAFRRFCRKHGLQNLDFHNLRHGAT